MHRGNSPLRRSERRNRTSAVAQPQIKVTVAINLPKSLFFKGGVPLRRDPALIGLRIGSCDEIGSGPKDVAGDGSARFACLAPMPALAQNPPASAQPSQCLEQWGNHPRLDTSPIVIPYFCTQSQLNNWLTSVWQPGRDKAVGQAEDWGIYVSRLQSMQCTNAATWADDLFRQAAHYKADWEAAHTEALRHMIACPEGSQTAPPPTQYWTPAPPGGYGYPPNGGRPPDAGIPILPGVGGFIGGGRHDEPDRDRGWSR
jgi:hypothetical protein